MHQVVTTTRFATLLRQRPTRSNQRDRHDGSREAQSWAKEKWHGGGGYDVRSQFVNEIFRKYPKLLANDCAR